MIERQVIDENLITDKIINNMLSFFEKAIPLALHQDAGVNFIDQSMWYLSGSEFPLFNGVFNKTSLDETNTKSYFSNFTQFFLNQGTPFTWWWTSQEPVPTFIQQELEAHGFNSLGIYECLAVQLDTIQLMDIPDYIDVKEVSSAQDYDLFIQIIGDVFHLSEAIKLDFKNMLRAYGKNELFRHYLGYCDGQAVTTMTSYIKDDVVGLYTGATLEKFQKQGVASAVGQFAMADAIKNGCEIAVTQLMAPGMAKGVCEKMGAKTFGRLIPFVKA